MDELRDEDGFMLSCYCTIINCFEWNEYDFPGDALFKKCSLSFKDSHNSWQQEAVANDLGHLLWQNF